MSRQTKIDLRQFWANDEPPPLSSTALDIARMVEGPSKESPQVAALIERDRAFSRELLGFVNSSYFGFSREIASVRLAVTVLGVVAVKNFALWFGVFRLISNTRCEGLDVGRLWQDSLRRGLFARALAHLSGSKNFEEAFAAAMLQDMAIPLLARGLGEEYCQLLEQRENGRQRLSTLERHRYGWDHAQAAGVLARQWNLPLNLARLLEDHTSSDTWENLAALEPVQLAVRLSSLLPAIGDEAWPDAPVVERVYRQLRPAGGPTLQGLFEGIDNQYAAVAPVLSIAPIEHGLSEIYSELATAR